MLDRRHWDFRRGIATATFTAADWSGIADRLEARAFPAVAGELSSPVPGTIDVDDPGGFHAKLSGASSPYSWAQQQGTTGGLWQPRVSTGKANAYEVNATAGLDGKVAWLVPGYEHVEDYRFQWVSGAGSSPPPPPPPPPPPTAGCTCGSGVVPTSLSMSSAGPCVPSDFQACTIAWGATPSWASGLALGSYCYLSTARFLDPFTGGYFYYTLNCSTIYWYLSRVYDGTTNYGFTGTPYQDATIYTWQIGTNGNTCSPFDLVAGTIYPGGNNACVVSIS